MIYKIHRWFYKKAGSSQSLRGKAYAGGAALVLLALLLDGCSVALKSSMSGEGTVYYLPKTFLDVYVTKTVDASDKSESYTIYVEASAANDPAQRFVLTYSPNVLYDDRFCIGRQENGLLSTVQFAAEDRSQQIVFNVSQLIAGSINLTKTNPAPADGSTSTLKLTIDPASKHDVIAFNNALEARFGKRVKLDLTRYWQKMRASGPPLCFKGECEIPDIDYGCPGDEICYRTQMTVPVDLVDMRSGKPVHVDYVPAVNPFDIGRVSIRRALLVEKVTKLWFGQNGALMGVVMRKPSEAEGATFLPLNVARAALTTPSGLLEGAFSDNRTKANLASAIQNLSSPSRPDYLNQIAAIGNTAIGLSSGDKTYLSTTCAAAPQAFN